MTRTRTTLTELETIRIRHLVEDHAAEFFGGPLQLGVHDAIRYTAEAYVEKAFPGVAYETLWAAIRAVLNADITILDRRLTDADRAGNAERRKAAAQPHLNAAHEAYGPDGGGDLDAALRHIAAAEREDPTNPAWAHARAAIASARAARTQLGGVR